MTNNEARKIIEALANGRCPVSGEVLPPASLFQHPDVVRALFIGARALERSERNEQGERKPTVAILQIVAPDARTTNPSDQEIGDAVRNVYAEKVDAVILVANEAKNLFMQLPCGGKHIEYCVGSRGPIYSADGVSEGLAIQMFLAYARGTGWWRTSVEWKIEANEF